MCGGARFEHGNRFVGSGFTSPSSSGRHRVYTKQTHLIIYIILVFFSSIMYDYKMCVCGVHNIEINKPTRAEWAEINLTRDH